MPQPGIGRQIGFGSAKETTRGTAASSASYWHPFSSFSFNPKYENVTADESIGVIEDSSAQYRVKNYMDGKLTVPLLDQSTGLFFYALFGSHSAALHGSETAVWDHTFTVGESAQHQSLTFFQHDPIGGTDYSYANGVVYEMDLNAALKKFVELDFSIRAQNGTSQSSFTPSILAENRFLPQYMTFKYATTVSGLSGATAIPIQSLKLTVNANVQDDDQLGSVAPLDFFNKEFKVTGQLTAIYKNDSDFQSVALATPNIGQAMLIDLKNTDVTIGTGSNPELKVTLNQVYFTEYGRKITVKDIVYQDLKFSATYRMSDSAMITAVLTNAVSSY